MGQYGGTGLFQQCLALYESVFVGGQRQCHLCSITLGRAGGYSRARDAMLAALRAGLLRSYEKLPKAQLGLLRKILRMQVWKLIRGVLRR